MLKNNLYPFAAVVGQEEAKKALLIALVNRRAGGLLIGGAKGTAKSVLARSVQSLIGAQRMLTSLQHPHHGPAEADALGRFEAPLPSSRSCNASCIGCISAQEKDSPIQSTPQCRLAFTPSPEEIAEVMRIHSGRETRTPIYSIGQGCEGDPLMNPDLLVESVRQFRAGEGPGTVNCNTNASRTDAVIRLAEAGLTSMRVSLNSARAELYNRYYRPSGYSFDDVRASIREARSRGVWVSLNLLVFPGVTDTEEELDALAHLVGENGVSMIQWRNLNIDPEWYFKLMSGGEGQEKL